MNYSHIQRKATYQPQGKEKSGHIHEKWRHWFKINIYVCEMHFVRLRLGVDRKKSVGQDVEV